MNNTPDPRHAAAENAANEWAQRMGYSNKSTEWGAYEQGHLAATADTSALRRENKHLRAVLELYKERTQQSKNNQDENSLAGFHKRRANRRTNERDTLHRALTQITTITNNIKALLDNIDANLDELATTLAADLDEAHKSNPNTHDEAAALKARGWTNARAADLDEAHKVIGDVQDEANALIAMGWTKEN